MSMFLVRLLIMRNRIIEISQSGFYLRTRNQQLELLAGDSRKNSIPMEDISAVILDNPKIIVSQACLSVMAEHNIAVIVTNSHHQPSGMMLSLDANTLQAERFRKQAEMPLPLKKRLWQQIVINKIKQQALVINMQGNASKNLDVMAGRVRSGDPKNIEAQAARIYWQTLFDNFKRDRGAGDCNRYLNYGYTVIRALTVRSLCAAGLHPGIGLHHHNKYSSFPLADDLMEPFRPFVDCKVLNAIEEYGHQADMKAVKPLLLSVLTDNISFNAQSVGMISAIQNSAQSLWSVIKGTQKQLLLPDY